MKTLFSIPNFCILVIVLVSGTAGVSSGSGGGGTPIILREWAGYSGISDSVFKNPVLTDGDYTFTASVSFDSITGPDLMVVKYDPYGARVWTQIWSSSGYGRDQASSMTMDNENLYLCGASFSSANNFDFVTMKLNKLNGTIEWIQTYNGAASNYDIATAVVVHDSSVYVTGVSFSTSTAADYNTIKYHKDGTYQWSTNFDYNNLMDIPFALSYSEYDDSTIIVTGGSQSSLYDWDYQTLIYDYTGSLLSQNRVSGSSAGFDRAQAVAMDDSGYIYLTGATFENASNFDIKNVKLDKTGNLVWLYNYDSGGNDIGNDIIVDTTGQPYVCGSAYGYGQDYFVARLKRNDGGIDWSHTINIDGSGADDSARAMCFDSWGNIVVTGQAFNPNSGNYDFLTIAFKTSGEEMWRDYFDGPYHGDDNATDITSDINGNIFVTGQVTTEEGIQTVTIKYRTDYFMEPPAVDTPSIAYLFYPNEGQLIDINDSSITDSVHYYTIHHSPQLYFGFGVMNMVWSRVDVDTATTDTLHRVDVTFLNSTNQTEAFPANEDTSGYLNYYLGHCPNGITNVHGSGSLVYTDVWSDIDVIYSSNNAGLKMTFVCNPGSNPQEIGLAFEGQDDLSIDQNWFLKAQTLLGDYKFDIPRVYQLDTNNSRILLSWQLEWDIPQTDEAVFSGWGTYDLGKALIIEISNPVQYSTTYSQNLIWSTYFGGDGNDEAYQIISDHTKYFYVVGSTRSSSTNTFPVTTNIAYYTFLGISDAIVGKFDMYPISGSNTNQVWCTFFGGDGEDIGNSIALDESNGDICFTGSTKSPNNALSTHPFPTQDHTSVTNLFSDFLNQGNNFQYKDAYYVRLNTNGDLIYSTYLGGSEDDAGKTIAINQSDHSVYIGGGTVNVSGLTFPLVSASSTFSNSYNQSTYGGNGAGMSGDGFLMRFGNDDNCSWSTFFGGRNFDEIRGLAILDDNKVIVSGLTNSNIINSGTTAPCLADNTNHFFPVCDPGGTTREFDDSFNSTIASQFDLFLAAFTSSDELVWSTYFGGAGEDATAYYSNPLSTTIVPSQKFSVVGSTTSTQTTFPVTSSTLAMYYQDFAGGTSDGFISKFNGFDKEWCTFYGGDNDDIVNSSTFDSDGNLYLTGTTLSATPNLNTCTPPAGATLGKFPLCHSYQYFYYQPNLLGSNDGFICAFDLSNNLFWSSYIGGINSENLLGSSITCLGNNIIIYGTTNSSNDPLNPGNGNEYPIFQFSDFYYQDQLVTNSTQISEANDMYFSMFDISFVTGIKDIKNTNSIITLVPNPSNSNLSIIINSEVELRSKIYLEIYDIIGNIILKNIFIPDENNNAIQIDAETFAPGCYLIKVNTRNEQFVSKFIKQ